MKLRSWQVNLSDIPPQHHRYTAVLSRFSSLITAHSALYTSSSPRFPGTGSPHLLSQRPPTKRSFLATVVAILVGVLAVFFDPAANAQVGGLDSSFNAGAILSGANNGIVRASIVTTSGQLLIAGDFTSVDGVARGNLAKLNANGSLDQTFASGAGANGPIHAMALDPSGNILIGGEFTTYDGVVRNRIARLTSRGELDWTFSPSSGCDAAVYCIAMDGSSVYIGGDFTTCCGSVRNRLAVLGPTGTLSSVSFNGGANAAVRALRLDTYSGGIYAGGDFTILGGATRGYFGQFSLFSGVVSGSNLLFNGPVRAIDFATPSYSSSPNLFVGGDFTMVGSFPRGRLAAFTSNNGGSPTLNGAFNFWLDGPCRKIVVSGTAKVLIGGDFTSVNGLFRSRFASFSSVIINIPSSTYWDLNVNYGEAGPDGSVHSIGMDADGRPLLGGAFTGFASIPRNGCMRLYGDAGSQPPATPASISARTLSDTQIYVSWGSSSFASAYTLECSSDGSSGWTQLYNGTSTSFTEASLPTGLQRFYRVRASNYNGSSIFTSAVSATTNSAAWLGAGSVQNSLPPGSINGAVSALLRQSDGKIVVAGSFTSLLGSSRKYIARLLPDLTLDSSFNPGVSANSPITQIQLAPNGGIYIFGSFSTVSGVTRNYIARLTSSGALDTTFNATSTDSDWVFANGIRIQADGRLIVFGNFDTVFGAPRNNIARLHLDGSTDTSFDCFPGSEVKALAIQANGKVLLAGSFASINGITAKYFARADTSGFVDSSFAGSSSSSNISTLTSLATGKHFATGSFTSISGVARKYLARLNENGSVDTTFDPGISASTSSPLVFPQPDGKVIVVGSFTSFANTTRWKTARLNADGALDSTFTVEAGSGSGLVNAMLALPDGSLLVGGTFTAFGAGSRSYLVQLKGDGNANVPSVPQNLTGTALSASSILLNWNQLPDEYSWKIERSPVGAGAWQQIAELEWDVTSFTDTQLSTDTSFDYRIRAWNSAGDSPYSNTAIVRTLNAFDQWKLDGHFPVATLDSFDGDGDGVGLFLEYALGLDPAVADSGGMPVAEMFGGILAMSYPRLCPELDYVVESSIDFVNWSNLGVHQGSGWYPTAWTLTGNEPRLFLRLRVSR